MRAYDLPRVISSLMSDEPTVDNINSCTGFFQQLNFKRQQLRDANITPAFGILNDLVSQLNKLMIARKAASSASQYDKDLCQTHYHCFQTVVGHIYVAGRAISMKEVVDHLRLGLTMYSIHKKSGMKKSLLSLLGLIEKSKAKYHIELDKGERPADSILFRLMASHIALLKIKQDDIPLAHSCHSLATVYINAKSLLSVDDLNERLKLAEKAVEYADMSVEYAPHDSHHPIIQASAYEARATVKRQLIEKGEAEASVFKDAVRDYRRSIEVIGGRINKDNAKIAVFSHAGIAALLLKSKPSGDYRSSDKPAVIEIISLLSRANKILDDFPDERGPRNSVRHLLISAYMILGVILEKESKSSGDIREVSHLYFSTLYSLAKEHDEKRLLGKLFFRIAAFIEHYGEPAYLHYLHYLHKGSSTHVNSVEIKRRAAKLLFQAIEVSKKEIQVAKKLDKISDEIQVLLSDAGRFYEQKEYNKAYAHYKDAYERLTHNISDDRMVELSARSPVGGLAPPSSRGCKFDSRGGLSANHLASHNTPRDSRHRSNSGGSARDYRERSADYLRSIAAKQVTVGDRDYRRADSQRGSNIRDEASHLSSAQAGRRVADGCSASGYVSRGGQGSHSADRHVAGRGRDDAARHVGGDGRRNRRANSNRGSDANYSAAHPYSHAELFHGTDNALKRPQEDSRDADCKRSKYHR